ncbi:MAG: thioredoxin domain-containing protein [Candidatus Omnitrophota bacterium]
MYAANRLINETSPYLLQHAYNPVDWRPWGEEALRLAQEEDKPIFLSIGYSACHWCHVMERECFENEPIADFMNENFVNIKVDREERPDLDEIYMTAVQLLTGSGGWPLSIFLTPDLKPFYGGTYFPPNDMLGRPGFPSVLVSVANAYRTHRDRVAESAEQMAQHLIEATAVKPGSGELSYDPIDAAVEEMKRRFDSRHGGFGPAPKFPHSMDLSLLLRAYRSTGEEKTLRMAKFTLDKMACGGMYDLLGGGFHRYSTDDRWLVPHFEKMLYDNALLARTYLEAYQMTQNPYYERIARETLDYLLREMAAPEGGFYSSQDADSEGGEGAFFLWTPQQIAEAVGGKDARAVCRYYGVDEIGDIDGGNVLCAADEEKSIAALLLIPQEPLAQTLRNAREKLFAVREKRSKPGRDEKILADWNGLTISSLALADAVLDEPRYRQASEKAADFLLDKLVRDGVLLHVYKDGRMHTPAFLSDYSFLVNALLDLYETTGTMRWLREALLWNRRTIERFWDEKDGGFFFTAEDGESRIVRSKNPLDNAVPSGNSIAILALARLAAMTGDGGLRERAEKSLLAFSGALNRMPSAFPQMLCALDFLLSSPREIVLAGKKEDLHSYRKSLFASFLPNKVILYAYPEAVEELVRLAPAAQGKAPLNGKPAAYVCRNFACRQPVVSVEELMEQLLE